MPSYQIIYWRGIPSQVIVSAGGRGGDQVKMPLSVRFEKAIDRAAMASKNDATDDYLMHWRKSAPMACDDGDLSTIATQKVKELEEAYPDSRLDDLIDSGGIDPTAQK